MNGHTSAVLDRLHTERQLAENAGDKPILERSFKLAIEEIEGAYEALRLAHTVLAALVAPTPGESALHIYAHAVEAEAKIRRLLNIHKQGAEK
jgi:hypothetical protein